MNAKLFILFILFTSTPAFVQVRPDKTPTKFDSLYKKDILETRREIYRYENGKTSIQLIIDSTIRRANGFAVSNWATPYNPKYGTALLCNRKNIYDEKGNLVSENSVDSNGVESIRTKYFYNDFDKIIKQIGLNSKNELYDTREYEYDSSLNLITEKINRPDDSFSYHIKYSYDNKGKVIQMEHVQNVNNPDFIYIYQYSYDKNNRLISDKQYRNSLLEKVETKEYLITPTDSAVTTNTAYYISNGPIPSDTITSKTRLVQVYTKEGKLKQKTLYKKEGMSYQILIKYDSNMKMIEKLESGKERVYTGCSNGDDVSVTKYIYDSNGRILKEGCGSDGYFTGSSHNYNTDGRKAETIVFRNGTMTMKTVYTYTYAK
jgi:hypothetical protein